MQRLHSSNDYLKVQLASLEHKKTRIIRNSRETLIKITVFNNN